MRPRTRVEELAKMIEPTRIEPIDTPGLQTVLGRCGNWKLHADHSVDMVLGEAWVFRLAWQSRGGELRYHFGKVLHRHHVTRLNGRRLDWVADVLTMMENHLAERMIG